MKASQEAGHEDAGVILFELQIASVNRASVFRYVLFRDQCCQLLCAATYNSTEERREADLRQVRDQFWSSSRHEGKGAMCSLKNTSPCHPSASFASDLSPGYPRETPSKSSQGNYLDRNVEFANIR